MSGAPKAPDPSSAYSLPWPSFAVGLAVAATTTGILVLHAVTGGPSGMGPSAFAVQRHPDGVVSIKVVDTEASAEQMTRQLRAQGLKVTVKTAPAAPQLVGRWIAFGGERPSAAADAIGAQILGYTATIDIPYPGPPHEIDLWLGRKTEPGEQAGAVGTVNAAAPSGLLYCHRLSGAEPASAAARLAAAGYAVHWLDATQQSALWPGETFRTTSTAPQGLVTQAITQDAATPQSGDRHVYLRVLPTTDRRFHRELWTGYPLTAKHSGTRDHSDCGPATSPSSP